MLLFAFVFVFAFELGRADPGATVCRPGKHDKSRRKHGTATPWAREVAPRRAGRKQASCANHSGYSLDKCFIARFKVDGSRLLRVQREVW